MRGRSTGHTLTPAASQLLRTRADHYRKTARTIGDRWAFDVLMELAERCEVEAERMELLLDIPTDRRRGH